MIETIAYDLETDLLIEIVKMLVTGDIDALDWRTKKLQQMGLLDRKAQELVNRYRAKILSGVDKEFEQTIENEIRIIRQGLPKTLRNQITMDTTTRMVMETWATQAKRNINMSLVNITETTKATYINAINKASLGYVTNTYTRDEALKQSITQMKHLEVYLDTAGRRWTPEGYVSMVLKSNKRQVVTDLQLGAAQELGTDIIEVSEHAGARPGCAPFQGRFFSTANRSGSITDGAGNRIYFEPLSSTTYGQPAGLFGINCVIEGTLVSGFSENAVYRRKYTGEIFTVRTASGYELSVTPNHPILTNRGWVSANKIKEGDNVISRAVFNGELLISPNPYNVITAIEEKFNFLFNNGDVFRLPASSGDFHGDIPDHDIDVVFKKGFLNNWRNTFFRKQIKKFSFHTASKPSDRFQCFSSHNKTFIGSLHASNSIMSGASNYSTSSVTSSFMYKLRRFASIFSNRNTKKRKISSDRAFANPDFCSNLVFPHTAGVQGKKIARGKPRFSEKILLPISNSLDANTVKMLAKCLRGAFIKLTDESDRLPGTIQLDRVISIQRKIMTTHVYNLQTETGWYFSNNILSHNCGHRSRPFVSKISIKGQKLDMTADENREIYAQSQQQRRIENQIRTSKREIRKWEAAGDKQQVARYKEQLAQNNVRMKEFISESGRTRRTNRERIY